MSVFSLEYFGMLFVTPFLSWIFNKKTRKYLILLANVLFMFLILKNTVSIVYALILAGYTWLSGMILSNNKNKATLFVSLIFPVLGLVFFKYAGYFSKSIIMPLGLSFYTFKVISYLVDIYNKKVKAQGIVNVYAYILFFPCFLAGPIHRSKDFFVELKKPFRFEYQDQKNGFILMMLGFFEKLVIGDELFRVMNIFSSNDFFTGIYKFFALVLYALYIYVDFDSYSNIAIGASRMLGFHLKRNFHTPYLAVSIQDFWSRWHISLSTWLKDYIYIPLGGNRKGIFRKYINVLVVFLVSGLWHGSTLMFVIWGIGHGLINIIEDAIHRLVPSYQKMKFLSPLRILINFMLVSILWVFFKSGSMNEAISFFQSIFVSSKITNTYLFEHISQNELLWTFVLLGIVIITDICRYYTDMITFLSKRIFIIRWAFYIVLILFAIVFGVYGPGYHAQDFIYVTF